MGDKHDFAPGFGSARYTVHERPADNGVVNLVVMNPQRQVMAVIAPSGADIYQAIQEMIRNRGDTLTFCKPSGRPIHRIVTTRSSKLSEHAA